MPRSLWQWAEMVTFSIPFTRRRMVAINSPNSEGMVKPTVSGILSVVAPASRPLRAPGRENRIGTRGIFRRKFHVIAKRLGEADGFASLRQTLLARDAQLVLQVNVGGREEDVNARTRGTFKASQARSMSGRQARASPAMMGRRMTAAIAFTASKSPSEAMGNPASITSAPRRSS
jgi:hypothetical protein